ncbi:MFS transporter [Goodfellowiella coeruleoviolacea]|uniref:Drug resistance transporter, EmrB/QacA subfamily n=1 Tax=Goodfellowiella coeruleoviolacea TaxID=334858 RepID=A0AAE3KJ48_9PSEU|nr:MFS transporter [Goodfellowiella coeruleoviolacea]MCP2169205.1 drug resistance transporter, EmrB/QacA subfamily [Goodfellowiella coeruleoviolacea]
MTTTNPVVAPVAPPGLSRQRRLLVLAICCTSLFIVGLDNTIVNIALPAMQRDLNTPVSGLQWITDGYTVVLAGLLMLAGSTGDRIGRRRTFQTGLALFTLASLLCSLAPSLGWLVAARVLQAVGGSMLNPVAMSIITNTFTDPRERARAIGVWGGVMGISMALGPVVGGALVASVGWRSIFWINIPVGLAALVLCALFVPESRAPHPRPVDLVGQTLVVVLLVSLTYGLIEAPAAGWGSAQTLVCFGLAVLALAVLVPHELRRAHPLINPRFFGSVPFAGATVIAVCGFAALGGFLFLNTLYLQNVRGYSALHAGLLTLPMAGLTVVCAPLSGRVVGALGPRVPLLVAGLGIGSSALLLGGLTATTPLHQLIIAYVLFGLGFGALNAPITNTAVSGMPRAQAGVAAAVASTSRQIGQTLGVAVLGALGTSVGSEPLATGFPAASHVGWAIITGCGAAVLLLGLLTTGRWARRTAQRTADRLVHTGTATEVPA